jgi:hypothetical protein
MKTIATRIVVIAASALALGTMAFGQNKMTAEIPFAFRTATGALPAGHYEFTRGTANGLEDVVSIRNAATLNATFAGKAVYNSYKKAKDAPVAEFTCVGNSCSLTALRTSAGSWEYAAPRKGKDHEQKVAVVSVPLSAVAAE